MAIPKIVSPDARRAFLLECAQMGAAAVRKKWPENDIQLFLFGSAVNAKQQVHADSDLDIAVSGTDKIDGIQGRYVKILAETFRSGLGTERHTLPIDFVFIDAANPETWFAEEILKNGIKLTGK